MQMNQVQRDSSGAAGISTGAEQRSPTAGRHV
jgi:hypothetical protein